jgi:hypothetical protein
MGRDLPAGGSLINQRLRNGSGGRTARLLPHFETGRIYIPADIVFGGFDVHKPYFNLDSNDTYRQLGRIENRGIEASATLRPADGA